MSSVHWVLVPMLTSLTITQAVLALLAYSRVHLPSLLAHAIVCLAVVASQVIFLFLVKKLPLAIAVSITILYCGYVGVSVWLGVVLFGPGEKILYPQHFTAVQSLLVIANFITMASVATLAWGGVARYEHPLNDDESVTTVIATENKTNGSDDSRNMPSISRQPTTELETFRPTSGALAALHNKESQRTLVGASETIDDASTLNFLYKASLDDAALYDSNSGNWMNTMSVSYSAPYLKSRPLVSSGDSSAGSTWRRNDNEEHHLARNASTGLRIKKQRLMTRTSMDHISKERFGSPLRPVLTGPGSASLTGFKNNITKAATVTALAQKHGSEKIHLVPVPELESPGSPLFPELEPSEADNAPYRLSGIMDGLEDIPRPPQWSDHDANALCHSATHQGIRNVSLEEWEASKSAWLSQSHSAKPILYAIASSLALSKTQSAPSLHTYRQVSEKVTVQSEDVESLEYTYANPITPIQSPSHFEQEDSSPIKKMMGIFRKRDSVADISTSPSPPIPQSVNHKHTTSVANSLASFLASLTSGKSSRSNSPRKSIKSLFTRSSIYDQTSPQRLAFFPGPPGTHNLHRIPHHQSMSLNFRLLPGFLPSKSWEVETVDQSEGSRVSSIPSAVIGEYDREKWRTLKELERQAEIGV